MNRNIITFTANEQALVKTGGLDNYASNTVSYIVCEFELGDSWEDFDSVRAVFSSDFETVPAVLAHGSCLIPFEVLRYRSEVKVNLVGSVVEAGTLVDRLTSFPITALTVTANAEVDNTIAPISPSEFEEFVAMVRSDADRSEAGATASEASAETATAAAQASEASALRSANSATDAANSATASANSATQAQGYAQNASDSATSAENSANDAEAARDEIRAMRATATTLSPGSAATANYSNGLLSLGIPRGDKGETGDTGARGETGATPNLSIGTVTTLPPSGSSAVTITGTAENPVLNFDLVKGDTGEVSQAELDEAVTDLKSELTNEGVVQGANGLVSDAKISDSVPYLFRQTADGQRVGNVVEEEIIGGTVAFNQIAYLRPTEYTTSSIGVTYTPISESSFRLHGTISAVNDIYLDYHSDAIPHIAGHKYIAWVSGSASASSYFKFHQGTKYYPNILNSPYMYEYTSGTRSNDIETLQTGDVDFTFHWNRIDLTQMFGTTIADHLYQLETATAGAGVAVFRKMFPASYYPYNAGELKSVEGLTSHDCVGFNQFDKTATLSNGYLDNTGVVNVGTGYRYTDYIRVVPNTAYYFKGTSGGNPALCWYDADKNFISGSKYWDVSYKLVESPSNACYVRASLHIDNLDIFCINISSDRNGQYEPYVKHSYPLDDSLTLRGIPKLSDGKIYYDGDVYASDGTVTRKYGIVDLGTLTWAAESGLFYAILADRFPNGTQGGGICSKYVVYGCDTWGRLVNNLPDKQLAFTTDSARKYLVAKDTAYATASDFATAVTGVYLVYELATPTTETAEPYTSPQIVDRLGTEEYVTTGIVPVGHNSKYSEDLKGKLEELPWNFSSLIAPTETAYKATRNYTTGGLLIVNNILYKVTANIANGGTITPNTNVTATTLSEVIANL